MIKSNVFSEEDIADLPYPVKKYFYYCGYIGKEKTNNAKIIWSDVKHKRSIKSSWMNLEYTQTNSVQELNRSVEIKGKTGFIPLKIVEKYQNGIGIWQMSLFNRLKLIDVKDIVELNRTALVTFLSEALIIPYISIQSYIKWIPIDELSSKAYIVNNGIEVSGIFFFNEIGEFIRFETNDRYNSEDGKTYNRCKWTGICGNYIEEQGIKIPTEFKAIWNQENGDFLYFIGRIKGIGTTLSD